MTTDNDAPAAGLVEALQFYADPTHWRTANSDGSTRNDGVGLGYHQTGDGIMEVQGSHCGHWVPSNQMVHGGHWQADSGHIARRALAALQAPQEAGVSVKALEWEEDLESICTRATANALGGKMIVVELDPGSGDYSAGIDLGGLCFRLIQDAYHDDRGVPYSAPAKFSTIEAAKAAAQADFEARILSQIISQPAARQGIATTAPFTFSRYINGQLMAEGVTIERQATIEGAAREAARIASRGPNGEVPVLVLIAPEALSQPVATPAPLQDAAVEKLVDIAREHLEIDGDGEGPFIRFDSIENAVRAVLAATRPAEAQAVAEGWQPAGCHQVGTPVSKTQGYPFPGEVRSVFLTKAGEIRYVIEATGIDYAGMLHIFNPTQIAPLAASPATGGA